jgi:glycosyltransferase involved in cell wall biosynthesis
VRKVMFLQSKFPTDATDLDSLLKRWDLYGEIVNSSTNGQKIEIFSLREYLFLESRKFLISPGNTDLGNTVVTRFKRLIQLISSNDDDYTFVAGDNQLSLLAATLLKFRFPSRIRIQVQFHGNTYNFSANKDPLGLLRVLMSRVAIHFADSIRVVSEFQKSEIRSVSLKKNLKFVVSPIPIDFDKIPSHSSSSSIDILYVGRLHRERGIREFVSIISQLKAMRPLLKVTVVGAGPEKRWAEEKLSKYINDGTVVFFGHVSVSSLRELYSTSKVLLSTAPREGYGLSLREAALSGISVIARKSKGSAEAAKFYGENIEVYETEDDAIRSVSRALNGDFPKSDPDLKNLQEKFDETSLNNLIQSWFSN